MTRNGHTPEPARPQLSLRWKALIALSIVLLLVNATLALFAYRQLAEQFDEQQTRVRERQAKQLSALLADRYRQMSRVATVVPLLAPPAADDGLEAHLSQAMEANGVMLDLEWDIRSLHWVPLAGRVRQLWPRSPDAELDPELVAAARASPETTAELLACAEDCRQYLAVPLLWQGASAGALVLGRSVADALLTFQAVTGADVAIMPCEARPCDVGMLPALTHPERTRHLFRQAGTEVNSIDDGQLEAERGSIRSVRQFPVDSKWYEVFRMGLAPGVDALVLNGITAQREAIAEATTNSLLIGIFGLVLSEGLLLLVMKAPLERLQRLAQQLPLLAEQRFEQLRGNIATLRRSVPLRDEIDRMVETVDAVSARMKRLEEDREEARNGLIWLADHDPLTRLLNRRGFNSALEQAVGEAASRNHQGALFFIDLDQFKDVNDISGHQIGDSLLQRVAERLQEAVGHAGLLGRLGGDEFALVLPVSDRAHAEAMAKGLQASVQSVALEAKSWRHQVSASIGIVLFPEYGSSGQQLMADADLAMYQAKEKGRGRWHLFSPADEGRERANARVIWTQRIAAALAEDRYELHYQPIMEIATGRIWRAEALLRMRGPAGELVMPFSFIPIAEETGQIQAIDHWVLSHAIAAMAARPNLSIAVNLSPNALQDASLQPEIERLLAEFQIDPTHLTLEITESAAIRSIREADRLMRGIQALGCRFALDDFGSGFASYAYLRELPVDDVKIDGAFIREIASNREDRIFVNAITEMAHSMGKRVVAEFVEDEQIVQVLRDLEVDFAQGYYIGRPALPMA